MITSCILYLRWRGFRMGRISCSSSISETASISFLGSSSNSSFFSSELKAEFSSKEPDAFSGLSVLPLRERLRYPRLLPADSDPLFTSVSEFSCSKPLISSEDVTISSASVSIFAAMGLDDFFGRPRGFFSVFSSETGASSVSKGFFPAFFLEICLFLIPERLDLTSEFTCSSARDPLSSSTFASLVIEDCAISKSSVTPSLFFDSISRSSSDSSSSSFLRNASENARSSSIRASRSAIGIW